LSLVLTVLLMLVTLGAAGAAFVAASAARDWHHVPRRFQVAGLGALACGAVAVLGVDALFGGAAWAGGWRSVLRLLADAVLMVTVVLLVKAYRRADVVRLKAQEVAPVNEHTSLPNRATLLGQAVPALARCQRDLMPASVVAASIDGLARITQERGPRAAETLLRDFANVFRDATRAGDVPGHASAQVLAALLPSASPEAATGMADRLRREASVRLAHPGMDGSRLSVSVGIAPVGDGPTRAVLDEAIAAAEAALASAQAGGGDRVLASPAPPLRTAGQPS
jgi:diguanylate cyclase (GGDEF)-like protein